MKIKINLNNIKFYLKELSIVTVGVLIALIISNYKESNQAKDYYNSSIETVKKEVISNHSYLKNIVESHSNLIDTIKEYNSDNITLGELIVKKGGGLQIATINNSGLEFYKNNQIKSVDFDIMSQLFKMVTISEMIDTKMEKLIDFVYPNLFVDSKESKRLVLLYLDNTLNSELQLLSIYENYINEYIDIETDKK